MCQDGRIDFDRTGNRVAVLATRNHPDNLSIECLDGSFKESAHSDDDDRVLLPRVIALSLSLSPSLSLSLSRRIRRLVPKENIFTHSKFVFQSYSYFFNKLQNKNTKIYTKYFSSFFSFSTLFVARSLKSLLFKLIYIYHFHIHMFVSSRKRWNLSLKLLIEF